ncbi:MAG TPA: MBL fold metallo-hydrolase [Solirubrobacterales bacterium]|nr:MBL fold metallo-hydrolase [Solirubrobacterales bacterium]
MVEQIDTRHLGRERVIAAHLVRGLIVDPGPASALGNWLGGLEEEPRGVLLTHIHLDHAGGTGVLARRWPGLRVYVSEVGAPHLADPERLLRSAGRLYGEQNMGRLWGEVAPVPAQNIVALGGGEEVEGFRVEHVPGHASHHLCWYDLEAGAAYVGDMAGVRVPPSELTLAPTPPPEIDVEAWLDSVDRIEALGPERLRLTHFGLVEDVGEQFDRVREALREGVELSRRGRETFLEAYEARIAAGTDAATAAALIQATPPEQQWLGLERYLQKGQFSG